MSTKDSKKKSKKKKYPILGIRIDEETSKQLENEASRIGKNKSSIAKQAIRQWLLFFKPTEFYERMIIYKNVFGFCLDQLSEEKLRELSQLVMKNTFEKNHPNSWDKNEFKEIFKKLKPKEIMDAFEEIFLEARGVGRGWYSNVDIQYNKEKDSYYLSLTHQVSESFSKFLFINLEDMIEGYTFLDVEFKNPYFGEAKVSFHIKIKGIRN
jgi:hypothetical protein